MKAEGKKDNSRSCRRTNTLFCKHIAKWPYTEAEMNSWTQDNRSNRICVYKNENFLIQADGQSHRVLLIVLGQLVGVTEEARTNDTSTPHGKQEFAKLLLGKHGVLGFKDC
jgi:hypothetical protein